MTFNRNNGNLSHLRDIISEHRSPIVYWIGSGASLDAELPDWSGLRNILSNDALEYLASENPKNAAELESALNTAANTTDFWQSFDILKEIVGPTNYKASINRIFRKADTAEATLLHRLIWRQKGVVGIVSLNIDCLESKAHRAERPLESIDEFIGRDINNHIPTIKERRSFIARLHGRHTDSSSWVFTKEDLKKLLKKDAYKTAVKSIFLSYTVVFIGISADDIAAGGFLEELTSIGIDPGAHFWITSRNDIKAREWSDSAGILRIPYTINTNETHTSVINEIFNYIDSYVSKDKTAPPISYIDTPQNTLPSLTDIRAMDEDDIRNLLNRHAKHLLTENAYRTDTVAYRNFLSEYSSAIHQSWHLNLTQGYNKFFGFTAVEKIHGGAFSSVWRVIDNDGKQFALKIIQFDNLEKGPQLDSFRRGVHSQVLLKGDPSSSGIAKLNKAYEIPPSVIMEYVEGENLENISQKSDFDFWSYGIKIVINLCKQVIRTHNTRHGVLHRDIRPHNIMVPNYYYGESAKDYDLDPYAVKLLNYDMTWHTDAVGRVIPIDPLAAGYCAPELIAEPEGRRARDTRVDSYGIGMTIFRMVTKKAPPTGGSQSTEWKFLIQNIRAPRNIWFHAAQNYLRRIIEDATAPDTIDRLIVSKILSRIEALQSALNDGVKLAPWYILAENLIDSASNGNYIADDDNYTFKRTISDITTYEVKYIPGKDKIHIYMKLYSTSSAHWGSEVKNLKSKLEVISSTLSAGLWVVDIKNTKYESRSISISATIELDLLRDKYDSAEEAFKKSISRLNLD